MTTKRYDTDYQMVVDGCKMRIGWVKVDPADALWHQKDRLAVWLELDEPAHGTVAFAVYLPVKHYEKQELLDAVCLEVKASFDRFDREACERKDQERQEQQKAEVLNSYAQETQSLLER